MIANDEKFVPKYLDIIEISVTPLIKYLGILIF